jgi:hypothetical protein
MTLSEWETEWKRLSDIRNDFNKQTDEPQDERGENER